MWGFPLGEREVREARFVIIITDSAFVLVDTLAILRRVKFLRLLIANTKTERRDAMPFVIHFLVSMVAILIISYLFPHVMKANSFITALVAAFVLGIVNAVIRPVMVILTLPITLLTLGIFLLVINGLMLWIVSGLVPGFRVNGFSGAVLGSILISLVSWFLSRGIHSKWS